MAMVHVVVDGEGLIDQDPVRLQRFDERGKQCAVEIEEYDNDVIFLFRKLRPYIGCSFEVYRPDSEIGKVSLRRRGGKSGHDLLIAVHRIDVKSVQGEVECFASSPCRHIERLALYLASHGFHVDAMDRD